MEKEILKQLELQRKTIAEEHREYINEKVDRILEDMKIRKGLITGRKLIQGTVMYEVDLDM